MVKAFEAASDRKVDHALILICSEFMSYLLVICCDCLFLMFDDELCQMSNLQLLLYGLID